MIILDTNVISEIIKKQPDEHVANWLRNQDTSNLTLRQLRIMPISLSNANTGAHLPVFKTP